MYSGWSGLSIDIHFVDLEVSYDVLSPLPIVLSKHFNHPHPYIEIATQSLIHILKITDVLTMWGSLRLAPNIFEVWLQGLSYLQASLPGNPTFAENVGTV